MPTYTTHCEGCDETASIRLSMLDYESVKLGAKTLEVRGLPRQSRHRVQPRQHLLRDEGRRERGFRGQGDEGEHLPRQASGRDGSPYARAHRS